MYYIQGCRGDTPSVITEEPVRIHIAITAELDELDPLTASGLDPSLHFAGLLCCLHVFKPFLVLSSCSAFRPQECQ